MNKPKKSLRVREITAWHSADFSPHAGPHVRTHQCEHSLFIHVWTLSAGPQCGTRSADPHARTRQCECTFSQSLQMRAKIVQQHYLWRLCWSTQIPLPEPRANDHFSHCGWIWWTTFHGKCLCTISIRSRFTIAPIDVRMLRYIWTNARVYLRRNSTTFTWKCKN